MNQNDVIGGYKGMPIKDSMLGKNLKSRGFLSNNLSFRAANGLTPFGPLQFLWPTGAEAGAFWDFGNEAFMYRDVGVTPVTAVGQTVGQVLDKRLAVATNHISQVTSSVRPITAIESIAGWNQTVNSTRFDGIDDGLQSEVFGAGTFINGMDAFIAIKPTVNANGPVVIWGDLNSKYFGFYSTGVLSPSFSTAGAPTVWVNGVQVVSGSNNDLAAALGLNSWKVLEYRNLDLSTWTQIKISLYAGEPFTGNLGMFVICPIASAANRNLARRIVGASVGILL